MPRWRAICDIVDGIVWVWQRPTDPRDERSSTIIGAWPERPETDELARVKAIIDEHDETARPKP